MSKEEYENAKNSKSPYALKYHFYLEDAVGVTTENNQDEKTKEYVTEYIIRQNNLKTLARRYDLRVFQDMNFISYAKKYSNHVRFESLLRRTYKIKNMN